MLFASLLRNATMFLLSCLLGYEPEEALIKYGKDLTELAKEGKLSPVFGRNKEIRQCAEILSKIKTKCAIIVGEPGTGKTAIVEGLAQHIVQGQVPGTLSNCKLFSLDIASLFAGATYCDDVEKRLKIILKEVTASSGETILFVDEIHRILGAGALNAANLLELKLGEGKLRCIGTTTISEYGMYVEKEPSLARRFQKVHCDPSTGEDTIVILRGLRDRFELLHGVKISDSALVSAAVLSERYITERFLPDKAIDLLDQAAAAKSSMEMKSRSTEKVDGQNLEREEVTEINVAEIVSQKTGIPILNLGQTEIVDQLLSLEIELHKRLVGQDRAVESVADAIRRSRTDISDPKGPIASFLFMGPTGVGKTELAKALANYLFKTEDALLRFDMGEYMEKHSISRLIGAPPGYVGYGRAGELTEPIRRRPYSVILLDEIEKAHHEVCNLFLHLLDDGRLTDSQGRTVSFTNCVVILTSNVGSESILDTLESSRDSKEVVYQKMKNKVVDLVRQTFRPEFINRIDECIIFEALGKREFRRIVEIQLNQLGERLKKKKIGLHFTQEGLDLLATLGFDPFFGARPAKRVIQERVTSKVSRGILEGEFKEGDAVVVDAHLTLLDEDVPLHERLFIKKVESQ